MMLTFANSGGLITLDNQINGGREWGVDEVDFEDGTVWTAVDLNTSLFQALATPGADVIDGSWMGDVIVGGAGNDTLRGGDGDDVLDGGVGDDRLEGSYGADTYRYALGSGSDFISEYVFYQGSFDTLELGTSITADSFTVSRSPVSAVDLRLTFADGGSVTIENQLAGSSEWGIDQLRFADGATLDRAALAALVPNDGVTYGSSGADSITLPSDGFVVNAGRGNDQLYVSGTGAGTILFWRGDGQDTLDNPGSGYDRTDTLRLTDILPGEVALDRVGDTAVVRVPSTGDSISILRQFWETREIRSKA